MLSLSHTFFVLDMPKHFLSQQWKRISHSP